MKNKIKSVLGYSNSANELINNYATRTEMFKGKEHLVVPVVMMVEGVHYGSKGPLLYTAEELSHVVPAWNGIPVVVDHPTDENGNNISANTPEVLSNGIVGTIFNASMEGTKLKAEAWIDVDALSAISAEALEDITNQAALQVSVGVYSEDEMEEGTFNGETYKAIAHNFRPDHLALLPGGEGACSWDDGCGIRTNKSKIKNNKEGGLMKINKKKKYDIEDVINNLSANDDDGSLIDNELGFQGISELIYGVLNSMDADNIYHYLEEVYDNYFIYRVSNYSDNSRKLYKQSYIINTNVIELVNDPIEVSKNVTYDVIVQNKLIRTNKKGGKTMTKNAKAAPCKVDALIANQATKFTEDDREWLSELSDAAIDKLSPEKAPVVETPTPAVNSSTEVTVDSIKKVLSTYSDPVKFIDELMPQGLKEQMQSGLKMYEEKRTALITAIAANSKFKEENLKNWKTEDLQDLHDSLVEEEVGDYSAATVANRSSLEEDTEDMEIMLNLKSDK